MAASQAAAVREEVRVEAPEPGEYAIDPSHTTVGFVARHLMVTKVRGAFDQVSGSVQIGETPQTSSVDVAIATASINTRDAKRDEHLRSADFLDVERFPELRFHSTSVRQVGDAELEIDGDLTIRDLTKPVTLRATYEGISAAPWGGRRVGFSAWTEIDREDWGMTWNVALETGGVLVGKKVRIELDVQLTNR